MIRSRGQVWIETVIYTLIGLILIAMTLAYLMPKINQSNDRSAVEQSIEALNLLDQKVIEVTTGAAGSSRIIPEFLIKRGSLSIQPESDTIIFVIEGLGTAYSEPERDITRGRMILRTEAFQGKYRTMLTIHYTFDLTYASGTTTKKFTPAATPYQFSITNVNNAQIDITEVS